MAGYKMTSLGPSINKAINQFDLKKGSSTQKTKEADGNCGP